MVPTRAPEFKGNFRSFQSAAPKRPAPRGARRAPKTAPG
jgi:hypothetical protein